MTERDASLQRAKKIAAILVVVGVVFVTLGLFHVFGVLHFYEYTHGEAYGDGFQALVKHPSSGIVFAEFWIETSFRSRTGVISAGVPTPFLLAITINSNEGIEHIDTIWATFRSPEGRIGQLSGTHAGKIAFEGVEESVRYEYQGSLTFYRAGSYGVRLDSPDDIAFDISTLERNPDRTIDVADTIVGNQQLYNNLILGLILVTLGLPWFQFASTIVIASRPTEVVVKELPRQSPRFLGFLKQDKSRKK